MAIANPMNSDFMAAIQAVEALNGKDVQMKNYLANQSNAVAEAKTGTTGTDAVVRAVTLL